MGAAPPPCLLPVTLPTAGDSSWVMGMLLPHQPMGLGLWALPPGQPLYSTGSCVLHIPARPGLLPPCCPTAQQWVQGSPVLHTLPGRTQKLSEASNKGGATIENSDPTASPHQPALALLNSRTTMKPKAAVTTPAAPGKPVDLPEQGPAAFAEAFPCRQVTPTPMIRSPGSTLQMAQTLSLISLIAPTLPSSTSFLTSLSTW
ncbi:uncharacterized protein LOC129196784 [Grus americana]|uniref:uncharacterized protein LOC129196784 n=1 Tax=Grus americana TaxID=9117 RepID=UPI00240850E4|nr:uncharacterized protein LOC129196784 [Grus americana]